MISASTLSTLLSTRGSRCCHERFSTPALTLGVGIDEHELWSAIKQRTKVNTVLKGEIYEQTLGFFFLNDESLQTLVYHLWSPSLFRSHASRPSAPQGSSHLSLPPAHQISLSHLKQYIRRWVYTQRFKETQSTAWNIARKFLFWNTEAKHHL